MDEQAASTCSLGGSELLERLQAWQRIVSRATSRRVERDRITASYPNEPELLRQLRDLIASEADCCPFLEFRIEATPSEIISELRLPEDLPEPMRTMICEVLTGGGRRLSSIQTTT